MKKHIRSIKWLLIMIATLFAVAGVMEYSEWLADTYPVVASWIFGLSVTSLLYACIYSLVNDKSL